MPAAAPSADLAQWWTQFNDPLLQQLIAAALKESDTLATALSRIEQARAAAAIARANLQPSAALGASATRANNGPNTGGTQTRAAASISAGWELDLFGGNASARDAAIARYESSRAAWHAARSAMAAELATQYVNLRACEALLAGFEADAQSRRESDRLTQLKVKAGFSAPAEGALSLASAAEAQSRVDAQRAECDVLVKSLVALTAADEPELRTQLAAARGKLPEPAALSVSAVPADVMTQRPDIAAAEHDVRAAAADLGSAEAARYPRISLLGSIGAVLTRVMGVSSEGASWSFGPALDLPLFDGGRRAANTDAARARYQEAVAAYKSRVRSAVREVEQSLTLLASANARLADTRLSVQGYDTFLKATDTRYRAGAGSLLELEDARRVLLTAQIALLNVQRDQVLQGISLYRALGGGWSRQAMEQPTHANQ